MFNFSQKDTEFYDLFVESARYYHQGAQMLDEVLLNYATAAGKAKEIIELEHAADSVNDKILDKLNLTFITPIDREDIYSLANGLDDGVDLLQGALQRIFMFHIDNVMEGASTMTKLLLECTGEIITAFSLLPDIRKNQAQILDAVHKVSELESEGDRVYRHEVAYLFDNVTDPIKLIKWKDILQNLEDTLDHCEKISKMIRGVVMKYA